VSTSLPIIGRVIPEVMRLMDMANDIIEALHPNSLDKGRKNMLNAC
jgi:hypothetical protein